VGVADIFISYKREDWRTIEPLINALQSQKFDVWWDEKILPGEKIRPIVNKVLEGVACLIVVWSELSLESNWVPDEATYARDRDILLQVTFDSSSPPLGFQQLLVQDLTAWSGDLTDPRFQKVLKRIRTLLQQTQKQPKTAQLAAELGAPNRRVDVIRDRYAEIHNKRIFLIVGSFNEEWQIALNLNLMHAAQRADVLCSVLVPFEDHSFEQQRDLLKAVHSNAADYVGGVIICSGWPDHLIKELGAIVRQFPIPVIFVDRNPPILGPEIPPNAAYVSVNDETGGALAAAAVLNLAAAHSIKRILVMAGFAKSRRHESFQQKLIMSGKLRGSEIVITQDGKFDRWISENIAYNRLAQARRERKPFDVVFCTADSMTLGCLDAVERLRTSREVRRPLVIGYDGTPTTKKIIDEGQSPLARIVIQDSKELAGAAIAELIRLSQSNHIAEINKVIWIEPHLYPRLETTSL
jgi:ABC-type sugar transport system substrate-binding protein